MDTIFLAEQAIIKELDSKPLFMAFIGTLIDDWLEYYKFPFENGDEILNQILSVRYEVQKRYEEEMENDPSEK
ncbi:MAG: hypothetical protein J6S67_15765 [Methanobrevibacter sp.]|nr:hypothetical protein [Methanobrevibacter sp.]